MASAANNNYFLSLLSSGMLETAAEKLSSYFTSSQSATVNIAVIGKSGSGQSAFIDALQGTPDTDAGTAPTQRTHQFPNNDAVIVSELPGLGSSKFRAGVASGSLQFHRHDLFIVLTSRRFKKKDSRLAGEMEQGNEKFYFVQNQVDRELDRAKRWQSCFYLESRFLENLRNACVEGLGKGGMESPRVFLVSSRNPDKFDFGRLLEALEADLPAQKRRAFLLALPNITRCVIERKKAMLLEDVWKLAALSATAALIPIPGLSIACDIALLAQHLSSYRKVFNLDEGSLARLAKRAGKTAEHLRAAVTSTFGQRVSEGIIIDELNKATGLKIQLSKVLKLVPFVGQVSAVILSYTTVNHMLNTAVEGMAEDAKRVLDKSLQEEREKDIDSISSDPLFAM
ncbi:interferon-inducible GTPase 5-like [Mustelus asterias]